MPGFRQVDSEPYQRPFRPDDPGMFAEIFPTETAGGGLLRPNNRRSGAAQGKASFKRKVSCRICGFMLDLSRDDHSGGSDDGNGAFGTIVNTTNTYQIHTSTGEVDVTEVYGDARHARGGGCPLCGSKNGSKVSLEDVQTVEPVPQVGF